MLSLFQRSQCHIDRERGREPMRPLLLLLRSCQHILANLDEERGVAGVVAVNEQTVIVFRCPGIGHIRAHIECSVTQAESI